MAREDKNAKSFKMDQPWCVASKQLTDYSSPTVVLNVSKETHSPTKVVLREISLRRGGTSLPGCYKFYMI